MAATDSSLLYSCNNKSEMDLALFEGHELAALEQMKEILLAL